MSSTGRSMAGGRLDALSAQSRPRSAKREILLGPNEDLIRSQILNFETIGWKTGGRIPGGDARVFKDLIDGCSRPLEDKHRRRRRDRPT